MLRSWVIFLLLGISSYAYAQEVAPRCVWVKTLNEPVSIDSLTIVPSSLKTESLYVDIQYDATSGLITLSTERPLDSVRVCYQVFPLAFNKVYQNRTYTGTQNVVSDTVRSTVGVIRREEIFSSQTLQKSGTISRGVTFGSNQDVFVNSSLNLNLDGKLTDDLNIRASITDQNIPFQPEGNTQQLQDFDNVFIELYNEKLSLIAGDVVLRQQPSHFLRYYKNVQGGRAQVRYRVGDSEAESSVGISVAKGQFESTLIPAKEGILGPYLIPGPQGRPFVIILANSERVYLDGRLLERGFNRDYTIDYNQAQITFTNRILITEFSRIRIDYEYSDQDYNRSILAASHEQKIGKLTINAQAYREADNRNRPLFGDLSNEEKQRLSDAGDDLSRAITSGVDSVTFTSDQILYARKDTLINGVEIPYYAYSTDPENARFRISFTDLGEGRGNYVLERITANGRVYAWVAPVAGVPQGRYAPVVRLPVPNKRQMITLGGKYEITENEEVFVETAFSNHDQNLYSTLDAEDNQGFAIRSGIRSEGRKVGFLEGYTLQTGMDFEYDSRNFLGIDRFRAIEFNRNWNLDPSYDTIPAVERILNASVGVVKNEQEKISYHISYRNRENQVNGTQQEILLNQRFNRIAFRGRLYHMGNNAGSTKATWWQANADVSFLGGKVVPGYLFSLDKNRWRLKERDTSVMYFSSHTMYLRQGADSKWDYDISYTYRDDERPLEGQILPYSTAHTGRFQLSRSFDKHRLRSIVTYRKQDLVDRPTDEESISSRIEWQGGWFDNHLRTELTYAVSNSQELRREFVYVKVPAGEGTHTWRDLNEDGVQDLNEFFLAINPDERNFAKIFVPTNTFETAFQNLLIAQVRFDFPSEWQDRGGLKSLLSRFSNNTSWTSDTKTGSDALGDKLFAFARRLDDVLAERNILRSTTFFNRSSSVYGAEFSYLDSRRKQLLTSGFEGVNNREHGITLRVNPVRNYNLKLFGLSGRKEVFSDFLTDRNYIVRTDRLNPQTSWQPGTNLRLTLQYAYQYKKSLETETTENYSSSHEVQFNLRYSKAVASVFNANLRVVEIEFEGEVNTPLGYELLNALQPGRNYTWNVSWQQRITRGLQVNLRYDGRSSGDARVIHTGRVQVSALF